MSRFNEHGLTPQQELFAIGVVSGKSLSDAFREAYPRSLKWAQKTVHEKASALMANGKVAARVRAMQAASAEIAILTSADILTETRRVALSSISAFVHPDGRLKFPHELDVDAAACVASFEVSLDGTIKYRFWDKNSAVERGAKILGLFEKDNKQKADPLRELLDSLGGAVTGVSSGKPRK